MDPTVAPAETPAESTLSTHRLPPQMIDEAAARLARLALVVALAVPAVESFQFLAQPGLRPVLADDVNRLVSLFTVLAAVGLYAARRYRVIRSRSVLVAGLALTVLVAFTIALVETTLPPSPGRPIMGISSVGLWIVAVGAVIPNRPVWTLVTALAGATSWLVAYAINARRFGFGLVPISQLAVWPAFNYVLAVVAYLISRRMYGIAVAARTAIELGSYRLAARIAEGGMGEVWRASHQLLARSAAIKLVRRDTALGPARLADLSARRFQREANVIARLQSPHTVYLYDFGVSSDGRFYYVMELLDGVSLQTLVTAFGPQPAARVVPILSAICESLEEAHRLGLVHRDLKPSNVMLCKVGLTHDFVKVLDFGLAKIISGDDGSTQLTMDGTATGTPGYIAPEVAMGEATIDGRADLYAVGCIAYFLLTGTLVFPDANPMSMALKHVQAQPDPPSTRTELAIPADLERIVLACLAKRPDARPPSAAALAELLAACDTPRWGSRDAEAWWQRHLPPTSSLRSFAQTASGTPAVIRKI